MNECVVMTQDGQRLQQLHPADARRFCDTLEHSLRVIGGNVNTVQSDIDELRDSDHRHADTLQRRSAHWTRAYSTSVFTIAVINVQIKI